MFLACDCAMYTKLAFSLVSGVACCDSILYVMVKLYIYGAVR